MTVAEPQDSMRRTALQQNVKGLSGLVWLAASVLDHVKLASSELSRPDSNSYVMLCLLCWQWVAAMAVSPSKGQCHTASWEYLLAHMCQIDAASEM